MFCLDLHVASDLAVIDVSERSATESRFAILKHPNAFHAGEAVLVPQWKASSLSCILSLSFPKLRHSVLFL